MVNMTWHTYLALFLIGVAYPVFVGWALSRT